MVPQPIFLRTFTGIRRLKASVRTWPRLQLPLIVLIATILAGRLLRLTSRYAVNIFFGDQWDFNDATLFQQHSWWQAFRWQDGPERQGLGAALEKLAGPWMRWNSRWDSFFICSVVLLALLAALALRHRLLGSFRYPDVIIPLVFLSPVSFEGIFGGAGANLAHGSLPLLLAVCYGLAWTVRRQSWRYVLVLLVNFLMIYTGFALFMGMITPLALLADWWLRASERAPFRTGYTVAAILVALLCLASFFWNYKLTTTSSCSLFPLRSPGQYFDFIALMFANFLGFSQVGTAAIVAGGAVVCLLLLALAMGMKEVLLRSPRAGLPRFTGIMLMGYCLLFCANAALGRTCLGLPSAFSSRYMMYLMTGLLGLYLFALADHRPALRNGGTLVLLAIGLLASVSVHRRDRNLMRDFYLVKHTWKECYLKIADIPRCDEMTRRALNSPFPATVYKNPAGTHLQQKLEFLRSRRLNLYADTSR